MNSSFEYISTLPYRLKAADDQIAAFKSDKKYIQMEAHYQSIIRKKDARIKALEKEVTRAHAETATVRNHWIEVTDDLDKECKKKLSKAEKALTKMEKSALNAERQRDDALDKLKEERLEKYRLGAKPEEEKGKNKKLTAQLNYNYDIKNMLLNN